MTGFSIMSERGALRLVSAIVLAAVIAVAGGSDRTEAQGTYNTWENDPNFYHSEESAPQRSFNPFRALGRVLRGREVKRPAKTKTRPARVTRPAGDPPKFAQADKNPNAGVILVVGDRMARGVADGLKFTLSDQPSVKVETVTQDKAGLAGQDAPDWSELVLSRMRSADVKAVVIMIGWRDIDTVFEEDPPADYMTADWIDRYRAAVNDLVRTVRRERRPVVWAGLPPTGNDRIDADFTQFNSIYQATAEDRRVRYVDLWDIFLADDGSYSRYGPDVDGKNARLRTRDRVGFTWAGYRKVAFFIERELLRLLGGYGGMAFEGIEDDPNFIVLTGRTTSPEALLLGGEEDEMENPDSAAYRLFVEGQVLPRVPGRVDDPQMVRDAVSASLAPVADGS